MRSGTQRLWYRVKRRSYRWWGERLVKAALGLFCFLLAASFLRAGGNWWRLEREEARLEMTIQRLKAENATLRQQIEALQTDAYIEKVAREQLGLVKPGEMLYYLPDRPAATRPAPPASTP